MKKIILSAFFVLFSVTFLTAQGFTSFDVSGAMFKANIKNSSSANRPSKVEVIVDKNTDISNLNFKYRLVSASQLDGSISKNFMEPQTVVIEKGSTSKEWIIEVKKLTPAKLPFQLNFSVSNPSIFSNSNSIGWTTLGTDLSKPTVVRYGDEGVMFLVAFEGEAKTVNYDLNLVGAKDSQFNGKFEVKVSEDGKQWKTIETYNSSNPILHDSHFIHDLDENTRFIQWLYVEREKQNINLNNIQISQK